MKLFEIVCLVLTSLVTTAVAQLEEIAFTDAPVVRNNPPGAYVATLLDKDTTAVRGTVIGTTGPNGVGVTFVANFSGFPDEALGPFKYHVHVARVPGDGNCTATLGHLDPYHRGEEPPCNATLPETCQLGDLSGKHGEIVIVDRTQPWEASYNDFFLSTSPNDTAFFGNLSIVVHTANTTRLNCGNFEPVAYPDPSASLASPAATSAGGQSNSTATVTVATASSTARFDGAASRIGQVSLGAVLLAIVSLLMV